MATAAAKSYWAWLERQHPSCPCGSPREQFHHVIHLSWQRITKDDMLVCGLCDSCHDKLHALGGDRQFEEETGISTVHLAALRRHNFERGGKL